MPVLATRNATAATTRAAYVPLVGLEKHHSATTFVSDLRGRGYNTLLVPLMEDGAFHLRRKGRGRRSRLVGPLADALAGAFAHRRTSVWLSIDPLSAGQRGTSTVGNLADSHREWLLRNCRGRLLPVGSEDNDPLFSWMNVIYRRFLGDHLVSMVEAYPFSAIVVDLRRYPGMSTDHNRWYCCSFQSQFRAEDALGIGFERLLYEGSRAEILRWQMWVLGELQAFLQNLAARVRTTRSDVSWKLLVPATVSSDPAIAPWLMTAAAGVADELIVDIDDATADLATLIHSMDDVTGRHLPIIPAWKDEEAMAAGAETFRNAPAPGYLVMSPDHDPEPAMPESSIRWEIGGALEDNPLPAAHAIATMLSEELDTDSEYGRRYAVLAEQLLRPEPVYNYLSLMQEQAVTLLSALLLDERGPVREKPLLLRDADLLVRVLSLVKLAPNII